MSRAELEAAEAAWREFDGDDDSALVDALADAARVHLAETEPAESDRERARRWLSAGHNSALETSLAAEFAAVRHLWSIENDGHAVRRIAAAREQGAAEMRERCAGACHDVAMDGLPATDWGHGRKAGAFECEHKIRALPTTPDSG